MRMRPTPGGRPSPFRLLMPLSGGRPGAVVPPPQPMGPLRPYPRGMPGGALPRPLGAPRPQPGVSAPPRLLVAATAETDESSKTDEIKAKLRAWHSRVKTGKQLPPTAERAPRPPAAPLVAVPSVSPAGAVSRAPAEASGAAVLEVAPRRGRPLHKLESPVVPPSAPEPPLQVAEATGVSPRLRAELPPVQVVAPVEPKTHVEAAPSRQPDFSGPLSLSEILKRKKGAIVAPRPPLPPAQEMRPPPPAPSPKTPTGMRLPKPLPRPPHPVMAPPREVPPPEPARRPTVPLVEQPKQVVAPPPRPEVAAPPPPVVEIGLKRVRAEQPEPEAKKVHRREEAAAPVPVVPTPRAEAADFKGEVIAAVTADTVAQAWIKEVLNPPVVTSLRSEVQSEVGRGSLVLAARLLGQCGVAVPGSCPPQAAELVSKQDWTGCLNLLRQYANVLHRAIQPQQRQPAEI